MKDFLKHLGLDGALSVPDELEELLFAYAARELSTGETRPGLMAKAYAEAEGDEGKSRAFYLKLRVAQLRPQAEAALQAAAQAAQEAEQQRREARLNDPRYCPACARLNEVGVGPCYEHRVKRRR